jgi:GNAT superfamily N-acetyltransferase
MTEISIRDVGPSDAAAVAMLCTQLGYPTTSDVIPHRLAWLAADANARAFIAERDGASVGLLTIHLRHTLNHEAPIGQITLMVVDENNRNHGVGRSLVDVAERWAAERGTQRMSVTTQLTRAGAHAFYEKVAYAHTGRRYSKDFSSHE